MGDKPFVSIVVPAFNEEKYISLCLESLLNLNYPKDRYNITVVDNNSKDKTAKIAKKYNINYLMLKEGKVGAVRNYGVKSTKSDVIAFIDADCVAGAHWLDAAVEKLSDPKVGAVGGYCKLRSNPSWVEKAWVLGERSGNLKINSLAGSSFIIARKLFEKLNGFDEAINAGEDTRLAHSVKKAGYELWFLDECAVVHLGYPSSIYGFAKRQYWHASSYIESNNGTDDLTFVAVLVFIFSISASFIFYALEFYYLAVLTLLVNICIPLSFTFKRSIFGSYKKIHFKNLISSILIDYIYFFSRAAGLLASLKNVLRNKRVN